MISQPSAQNPINSPAQAEAAGYLFPKASMNEPQAPRATSPSDRHESDSWQHQPVFNGCVDADQITYADDLAGPAQAVGLNTASNSSRERVSPPSI